MKSMLSQLLSLAAPDIRTTLNTIQGTLSLVGDKLKESEGAEENMLVQHANLSIQHLIALLKTVGDLDLIENQMMQVTHRKVELGRLVETIVDSVLLDPRSGQVAILVSYDEGLDETSIAGLVVDEEKFTQAFTNVLQYAVLFSRRDRVDIRINKSLEGRFGIHISDTSLGLGQAELDNLFSFNEWSGDALNWSMSNGIELNLNICLAKALMQLVGGDVRATSEIGKGIQWFVDLPLDAQVHASADSPTKSSSIDEISERAASEALHAYTVSASLGDLAIKPILLVDDSPSNRLVLSSMLAAAGYTVDQATDGMEALSAVRSKSYAAVLMDLAMPKMDGITAAREIRNLPGIFASVPLIALTAYVSDSDQQACLDAGFNEFLSKPVNDKDLLATLGSVLGGREEKVLALPLSVERLTEFAKIIGVVGVFNLLERFAAELRNRSRLLENLHLGNFAEVKHNLYMLVCSADNFGFDQLALATKNLSTKLSENQLQLLTALAPAKEQHVGDEFWSKELLALESETKRTLIFLEKYVGEYMQIETNDAPVKLPVKIVKDDSKVDHV